MTQTCASLLFDGWEVDSDADPDTGLTDLVFLASGDDLDLDAGLAYVGV